MIKNLETNYQYIQNFLMVTSIFVIFAYSVMIQKPFDHAVIQKIVEVGKSSQNAKKFKINALNQKCADPAYFTEKENKVGLFFMIISHLFAGNFLAKLDFFKIGFQGSYRSLQISSETDKFENDKWKYMGINLVMWVVFGGVALFLNKVFGAAGYGGNFPADGSCKQFAENLFMQSMINIWIITDVIISLISMPCLVIQYYFDKKF